MSEQDDLRKGDLAIFEQEEKNILREMRGACSRGGHGPAIRQLLQNLNAVQVIMERIKGENKCSCCDSNKKVNKVVAPKKATTK